MSDLKNHVQSIADALSAGVDGFPDFEGEDGQEFGAFDYLQDVLDIEYIVSGKGEYLGARVLVAFGGPNIWVDTRRGIVECAWWGDSASASFTDALGLDDALSELWACR